MLHRDRFAIETDCLLIGHYAMGVSRQVQLAEYSFGKNSSYYFDALEKTFITHEGRMYTSSQLYNLFYSNGAGDLSFDHVTFEHSFNTAIANIGTYLLRKGYSIDYVNTFNQGKQKLKDLLSLGNIRLVAIPTTFYISAFPIAQIVSFVRRIDPKIKIVIGGPFVRNIISAYRQNESALSAMLAKMGADYFVYSSRGEEALCQLIDALKQGDPVTQVPNIYYRQDGRFHYTFEKPENPPLQYAMSDWNFFKNDLPELVNIRTSISCPFDCAFCGLPVAGGKWRRVPDNELELELRTLYDTGRKPGIFFIDETLNFPVNKFKDMLQMMIRNNFGFKWEAEIRCDTLDEETIALMKRSGCQLVHLGIESGSQEILDKMTKRVDVRDYHRALALLHKYEILTSALILVGFPGETRDTFRETYDFIEECRPTLFRVHRWFYDHDTPVHRKRDEYRITGGGYNWQHYTMDSATAHELSTYLSLNIRNSIHTDDYSMAFYLLNKGYPIRKVTGYLKLFDLAIKEKCRTNACPEKVDSLVGQMKNILN